MADDAKTVPTQMPVEEFLAGLSDARQVADSRALIDIMARVSGHRPVMWGPAIIGFDAYHYRYDSGREGDGPVIGFSPRSGKISIYLVDGCAEHAGALARLGRHTETKVCLHVKRLSDIDLVVLEEILAASYAATKAAWA
ncbi:MAG: DUF1801 domain-containing protein [Aeromicrobium sp.]|uniref:DUF1801 domain-containing protein n=1 Tax=Aeromicrobium sp. TaxID=1871063 RepID=UPI0039E23F6B